MSKILLIAQKDITLMMFRGGAMAQALLLGLLLVFLFSLSTPAGSPISSQSASTMFWLASAFCQVLAFSGLYALEEPTGAYKGLLLAPIPVQTVWAGKLLAGLTMLIAVQCIFFPAVVVFLNQNIGSAFIPFLTGLLLTDFGMAALGALLGAAAHGNAARESLLSVIIFPLLVPILLAGIRLMEGIFGPAVSDANQWLLIAAAYDAIFGGAAFMLFPYVFGARH